MRKSIYIKEENLDIFEWAEEISTDRLSDLIAFALRKLKDKGDLPVPLPKENKIDYLDRIRKQQAGDYNY